METTVYVHLTEERGYYLPLRLGEPATVSETNTDAGTIFIAVATWIAQFIVEVSSVRSIVLWRTSAIYHHARYLCSGRLITARGRAPYHSTSGLCLNNNIDWGPKILCGAVLVPTHLLWLDQVAASGGLLSRPTATLVYLHFAAAIRRVVGCGQRRAGSSRHTTWREYGV